MERLEIEDWRFLVSTIHQSLIANLQSLFDPLRHQRRLAEASRGGNKGEAVAKAQPLVQTFQ
jgi:hypothetical protein